MPLFNEISGDIFQSIIEHNPDAVFIFSMEGKIVQINEASSSIFGYTLEEAKGMHYRRLIVHKHARKLHHHVREILLGKSFEVEFDAYDKNAKLMHLQVKSIPLIQHQQIIGIFCVVKDLTELTLAKLSLQESEKRYRLLADNSLDLIQLVNLDAIVTYASPSHKAVLGYDAEEYVGKWVLYQPDGQIDEDFKKIFVHMVLTQKSITCEIRRRHKSGKEVWLELKGTPMFDEDGNIEHMMLVGREITEQKEYQKELEFLSFHDPLTGVPNRRLFKELLEQTLKEAIRYQRKFAVMFLDLDRFKQINDQFGHDKGDILLKQFSNRIKSCLRGSDTLARLGGDEFTIILPEIRCSESDAVQIATRILAAVQEPWQLGDESILTTSSIGIAFYPQDGTTCEDLLKHADSTLYTVKENGRNNFQTYSSLCIQ
ncbi:diguanylate cyclase [Neobacillus sp. OS1-32]|uniref:Diguanylate cyclase n=1 Tax=Neobacillus paridis TaxID=2803862 RepID=A0ABS1TP26_9BACI|nr:MULTISPECIES: diguanylate cyclase [Neobacillus]MBL4952923.1 diguanylate cyclase [Neobacillus paridis]WML31557.1 diguanylate cyclase [Neobacillus sp. OS1-32]